MCFELGNGRPLGQHVARVLDDPALFQVDLTLNLCRLQIALAAVNCQQLGCVVLSTAQAGPIPTGSRLLPLIDRGLSLRHAHRIARTLDLQNCIDMGLGTLFDLALFLTSRSRLVRRGLLVSICLFLSLGQLGLCFGLHGLDCPRATHSSPQRIHQPEAFTRGGALQLLQPLRQ